MAYRKGIVYFIDVLGTQARTSSSDSFSKSYFIADTFLTEMEAVQQRHRQTSLVDRAVFVFSDCAYIVYSLKENVEQSEENRLHLIYQSLFNTQQTICNFVYNGFLCRGGIVYGDVYFDLDRNMIFGPAVNEAYTIESKLAVYPNITLEEELAKTVNSYAEYINQINPMAVIDGNILDFNDRTNMYFLNYLNYFYRIGSVQLGKIGVTADNFFERAFSYANEELQCHTGVSEIDIKIRKKQEWQIQYLQKMKNIIENDDFSEADLLNLLIHK